MSAALVLSHADAIEAMAGSGAVWALIINNCTPGQRSDLIDHHNAVRQILQRRGHHVRANVIYDEHGQETLTLRVVNDQWQTLDQ